MKQIIDELIASTEGADQQQDYSNKSVLARGCDPLISYKFSKIVPPLIGNAEYVPTTDDQEFIEQLRSRKWSVIYFAPGACRFSAAERPIPGGNTDTRGWTLEQYKELVYELQGADVQIAESLYESESLIELNKKLEVARATH